ncbi:MAG: hypothetical protein ACK5UT_26225 [Acidobacteriota bacterium]
MTPLVLVEQLTRGQHDPDTPARLAQELLADSRYPAALAVAELPTADHKAMALLDVAREPALAVLAASAPANAVADEAWKIRYLGQEMHTLRRDALRRLAPHFADRSPLAEGLRLCDAVYILATRLLHHPGVPGFRELPEKERNAVIQTFQQSDLFLEATGQ